MLGGFTCCEDDVSDRTFSLVGVGHEIFCRQSVGSWRLGWVCCTSLLGFLKACNVGHHICFTFRIWTGWWFVSSRRLYHRRKIWPRRVIWWGRRERYWTGGKGITTTKILARLSLSLTIAVAWVTRAWIGLGWNPRFVCFFYFRALPKLLFTSWRWILFNLAAFYSETSRKAVCCEVSETRDRVASYNFRKTYKRKSQGTNSVSFNLFIGSDANIKTISFFL